jgi:hypothetical protein
MLSEPTSKVGITDINMPFLSMVRFMIKWAIASIPAMLILLILGAVSWGLIIGIGSNLLKKTSESPLPEALSLSSAPVIDAEAVAYLPRVITRNVRVGQTYLDEVGVFGEIKNTGDKTLKEVELLIYCLGPDGRPIFEKSYHPVNVSEFSFGDANQPLKPGYSRQFGVKMEDAPSEWTKKIDVKVVSVGF